MITPYLPDVNRSFPGLSDATAVGAEVATLKSGLAEVTGQMGLERRLADDVHRARSLAIIESPALRKVFGVSEVPVATEQTAATQDVLSSAFAQPVETRGLPDGMRATVAKELRAAVHPDAGGEAVAASDMGEALSRPDSDGAYAVARALSIANLREDVQPDLDALRTERYRLTVAAAAVSPAFESAEEAQAVAAKEVDGAEWRVRTTAAFKSLELITGGNEVWSRFIQGVAAQGNHILADQLNTDVPAVMSVQERLAKGDPLQADQVDTEAVDSVFERIWSTLGAEDRKLPYTPPYHNWLPILLPAMRELDPGEKPGESYTHFGPIFETRPASRYDSGYDSGYDKRFGRRIDEGLFNDLQRKGSYFNDEPDSYSQQRYHDPYPETNYY